MLLNHMSGMGAFSNTYDVVEVSSLPFEGATNPCPCFVHEAINNKDTWPINH